MKKLACRAVIGALTMSATFAQAAEMMPPAGWTGEGTFSAGRTAGNTDTTDISGGLKAAGDFGDWGVKLQALGEYGKAGGIETRNRIFLSGQGERNLTDRIFLFGRGTYENDKFSGFDNRMFIGAGAGYRIFLGPDTTWALAAGPGWRRDVIQLTGLTNNSFGLRIGSNFLYKFNENVSLSNDTEYVTSDTSNQLINIAAVTSKLFGALAARVSFEVRNESNPRLGRKATDTFTRFSLVYGF
jgi:putative salt-induced outer membrane protein